jgi:heme exporter protein A
VSAPALVARGLEKRFGRALALRGIDLELALGSALALLGENGAGKSTLLRLAAGLARPSAGSLEVVGLRAGLPRARAQVGLVAHATLLYPELSARENLIFAGRLHGLSDPAARADALLEEEGLAAVAGRRVRGFSRGMAQRLAIARGLVHDPLLLLLDEPFAGLDPHAAARLMERLARLRRAGHALLLVTHDPALAVQLADCAVLLSRGRIQCELRGPELSAASLARASAAASEAAP